MGRDQREIGVVSARDATGDDSEGLKGSLHAAEGEKDSTDEVKTETVQKDLQSQEVLTQVAGWLAEQP